MHVLEPEVGRKYWWASSPILLTIEITAIISVGYRLRLTNDLVPGWCIVVDWTTAEWQSALSANDLYNWLPRINRANLAADEIICHRCYGRRWEQINNCAVIPCSLCAMAGKLVLSAVSWSVGLRRSIFHPQTLVNV